MKKILTFLLLTTMIGHNAFAASLKSPEASHCHKAERGDQGPPGENAPAESTAWGSFYTTNRDEFAPGDPLTFPITASIRNMTHPNDTDIVISQSGYYYINFAVSFFEETAFRRPLDPTVIVLRIDGTQVEGSRLYIFPNNQLVSTGLIVALNAGQTLEFVNLVNDLQIGYQAFPAPAVSAYVDLFRLAPL